jgi:hypothetical protein
MRIKFKIPFKKKKISTVPTEEDLVAAHAQMNEYPLLAASERLQALATNKFITDKGVQLHPEKFLAEVISFIEKSEQISKEDFVVYMEQKIASIVAPPKIKKVRGVTWFRKHS